MRTTFLLRRLSSSTARTDKILLDPEPHPPTAKPLFPLLRAKRSAKDKRSSQVASPRLAEAELLRKAPRALAESLKMGMQKLTTMGRQDLRSKAKRTMRTRRRSWMLQTSKKRRPIEGANGRREVLTLLCDEMTPVGQLHRVCSRAYGPGRGVAWIGLAANRAKNTTIGSFLIS